MGIDFFDQYSILHLAVGIIAFFWGMPLHIFVILHLLFEMTENTQFGINMINRFPLWPGGKQFPDSFSNSISDTIFAIIGWIIAFCLDKKLKNV